MSIPAGSSSAAFTWAAANKGTNSQTFTITASFAGYTSSAAQTQTVEGNAQFGTIATISAITGQSTAIGGTATYAVAIKNTSDLGTQGFEITVPGLLSGESATYTGGTCISIAQGDTTTTNVNVLTSSARATGSYQLDFVVEAFASGCGQVGGYWQADSTLTVQTPLTATVTASNKAYDGTTTATISNCTLSPTESGITCSASGATFAQSTVGTGLTVTATGITLSGTGSGNYSVNATATTTANITAVALTAVVTGVNKPYDGTTTATVTCATNPVETNITCSAASASFASSGVGTGIAVNATGITLEGPPRATQLCRTPQRPPRPTSPRPASLQLSPPITSPMTERPQPRSVTALSARRVRPDLRAAEARPSPRARRERNHGDGHGHHLGRCGREQLRSDLDHGQHDGQHHRGPFDAERDGQQQAL